MFWRAPYHSVSLCMSLTRTRTKNAFRQTRDSICVGFNIDPLSEIRLPLRSLCISRNKVMETAQ